MANYGIDYIFICVCVWAKYKYNHYTTSRIASYFISNSRSMLFKHFTVIHCVWICCTLLKCRKVQFLHCIFEFEKTIQLICVYNVIRCHSTAASLLLFDLCHCLGELSFCLSHFSLKSRCWNALSVKYDAFILYVLVILY